MCSDILQQVPAALQQTVSHYWIDWQQSCEQKAINAETGFDLPLLGKLWACSDFVARTCIRHPDMVQVLLKENINTSRSLPDYREIVSAVLTGAVPGETGIMQALRLLRQQQMLRIAWRDLAHCASTEQILYELSDLAQAIVSQTLAGIEKELAAVFGQPLDNAGQVQSLLILAMGKMGGRELNFSSDIDLIFAYAEDGETTGPRRVSCHDYFLRVARKLVRYLHEVTADGFVYRVDTRLRPNGESGPLVMSVAAMEQYYQMQGRNWERYAMMKARVISGLQHHQVLLQKLLTPFIFRRYLDYSAFASIREMKMMVAAQVVRKGMKNNIKLGRGGIREIEFIGQTFQLLRGGREPALRVRSIVAALGLLAQKNYLSAADSNGLIHAYWFLRKLENRLQMQRDQQTHSLPDDALMQTRLCLAMEIDSWDELVKQLGIQRDYVEQVFTRIIEPGKPQSEDSGSTDSYLEELLLFWEQPENSEPLMTWLSKAEFVKTGEILKSLLHLQQSIPVKQLSADNRRLLLQLLSSLLRQAPQYRDATRVIQRVVTILQSIAGRVVYLSMLNEYPALQQQLLRLSQAGDWFVQNIARYPLLLDSLLNTGELFLFEEDIDAQLQQQLKQIGEEYEDNLLEEQMDRLRQFKRQRDFKIAMLDVFYELPVATVADRLTETANAILKQVLRLAWRAMVVRYGEPSCQCNGKVHHPTLSIIGYGKLGGYELGYGSDLDIIFLHDSQGEKQQTTGAKSVDNRYFFARVAQRVIHLLSARTSSGLLYETDTRLRPDGQSGLLVSSLPAFADYQQKKAWIWEHQALIRARFITGSPHIEQEFDRIRSLVLAQPRKSAVLLEGVAAMRKKMHRHLTAKSAEPDIKRDAGGLIDIEFMTQAGVLLKAVEHTDCLRHTATLALISCLQQAGWYQDREAAVLAAAYRYFRKLSNWQSLKCHIDDDETQAYREQVTAIWLRLMPDIEMLDSAKPDLVRSGSAGPDPEKLASEKPGSEKS